MYKRVLQPPKNKSFFLFGPRGTGKTTWLKSEFPDALYFDLLDSQIYNDLLARPNRLSEIIPENWQNKWIILDEVQRVPELLFEVHRIIEEKKCFFALSGSSARKLAGKNVNLLAGRALTEYMHPLTASELGDDFKIQHSTLYGNLPSTFKEQDIKRYLESYVSTYLREEVQQEGLTRNLSAFSRFLEVASFSQAQILNISAVARESAINRKVAENYFSILEDLLISHRIPVFSKKAKRRIISHTKFFFFDTGVYRAIRPQGPLDTSEEVDGVALETLVMQEIKATNDYYKLGYKMHFWRTIEGIEVDFVLYGKKGIIAIEVKRGSRITEKTLKGLRKFTDDYPIAQPYFVYGGNRSQWEGKIRILPIESFLKNIKEILSNPKHPL